MKPELEKLIEKYLKGKCTEEERKLVETWYDQLNEDDGMSMSQWKAKSKGLKTGLYKKISLDNGKIRNLVFFRGAAAAIVLLLGSIVYLTLNQYGIDTKQELFSYAGNGQIEMGTLKETRLILDEERSIDLAGNAGIDYTKGELEIKNGNGSELIQKLETGKHAFSTLVVPYGRRAELVLSDGTKVWLNSGSRLVYPNVFKGNKREVLLQGEAFFDVAHQAEKPFHVYAKDVDVKVLGTSFNVRAYADEKDIKTTLVQGSVLLADLVNEKNTVRLVPGNMGVFTEAKSFKLANVDTEMFTSWKSGYLYLKNENLSELLKTLTRYYNISIQLDDPKKEERYFSGRLNLEPEPEQILQVIALTTGCQAEKTERGWMLKRSTDQL